MTVESEYRACSSLLVREPAKDSAVATAKLDGIKSLGTRILMWCACSLQILAHTYMWMRCASSYER